MIGSWADWDLTALGIEQANRIGARLAAELKGQRYVMAASGLPRARQTAEIVAGHLDIEPVFTDALREMNLGEAVGKPKAWARENARCPLWPGTIDWPKNIDDKPFMGAESQRDMCIRLTVFLHQILENEAENWILVSHDGALSIFFALWLWLDVEKHGLSGRTGGVSFLREDADGHRVIDRLNDMSYIM